MNTTANKNVNKTNAISNRACLLSFIPKRNAEHIDLSEVLECIASIRLFILSLLFLKKKRSC